MRPSRHTLLMLLMLVALVVLLVRLCITITQDPVMVSRVTVTQTTPPNHVKSELCPDPTIPPLSVFIGLKTTTATRAYSAKTDEIMKSWGPSAIGNLALITDGIDSQHNEWLKHTYPGLPIIEIIGSEKFGMYKNGSSYRNVEPGNRLAAHASQRIKTRSLIKWFHNSIRDDSNIKWLCYIDDDMYVNVNILNNELARLLANPPPTCSRLDRCVVADVGHNNNNNVDYSNAVWCMPIPTLKAVHRLLDTFNDHTLGWYNNSGSDDVGFAKLLQNHLNIKYTDSLSMLSVNNKIAVEPVKKSWWWELFSEMKIIWNSDNIPVEKNPVGSYTTRKVNVRGNEKEWLYLREHNTPIDVLARLGVLNLPHVNCTALCESERSTTHKVDCETKSKAKTKTSPRPLTTTVVDMTRWNTYVNPQPTCRQELNRSLHLTSSESFILKYKV